MTFIIQDRAAAGRDLARALGTYRKHADVVVLALPRGGVPVAAEIAHELHAPLDVLMVRKLGAPGHEELAMGAIADGGIRVLNPDIVESLGIGREVIQGVAAREQRELEQRLKAYRGERPWMPLEGKRVIIVDDGAATGATMRAAIAAVRMQGAAKIIVSVPVGSSATIAQLRRQADHVVCLATPEPFHAVASWYSSFPQLSDHEVRRLLSRQWTEYDAADRVRPGEQLMGAAPPGTHARTRELPRKHISQDTIAQELEIPVGSVRLNGTLRWPATARGLVVFVDGSGGSRFSTRNRHVAEALSEAGLATLLFDLLTAEEDTIDACTGELRFDIGLLSERLIGVLDWLGKQGTLDRLAIGLLGASTGAAAALNGAAARPHRVKAVVSRGGRPDLAGDTLERVRAPTLLIVGGLDDVVIALNERAGARLQCEHRNEIVPGATHLFEEPATLDVVARLACEWFQRHLAGPSEQVGPTSAPATV